jgi:hypothetical protein
MAKKIFILNGLVGILTREGIQRFDEGLALRPKLPGFVADFLPDIGRLTLQFHRFKLRIHDINQR